MPRLISSKTVNLIKRTVNKTLTDTCSIESSSESATGSMGQKLQSWEVISSGVSCRVIRAGAGSSNSDTSVQGGQEAIEDTVRIILPAGTVVGLDDRIKLSNGSTFQVVSIQDYLTDGVFVSVIGKRLR